MKKINLPLILDTLFAALCAFLLFFTSIRYYTKNVYVALAFAALAFFMFGALSFIYISKKQNKKLLLSRDEKQKKLLALHLSLSSEKDISQLLLKALNCDGEPVKIRKNKIISEKNAYFYNFKMQPLSEDDAAAFIKEKCEENKIILCNCISAESKLLCDNFLIEVRQIDFIYNLLKEKNLLPEKYVYDGAKKISIFKRIKSRFSKKLCAPLFFSGLALLFLSYFTFFPLYYILSGGIMLLLSAVALVIN